MLPEAGYLRLVGEVAYRVCRLEWAVTGDLLALRLGGADPHRMKGRTTADIAKLLAKWLDDTEQSAEVERWGRVAAGEGGRAAELVFCTRGPRRMPRGGSDWCVTAISAYALWDASCEGSETHT